MTIKKDGRGSCWVELRHGWCGTTAARVYCLNLSVQASNYRLYNQQRCAATEADCCAEAGISAFSHSQRDSEAEVRPALITQLQQHYHTVIQQLARLRQTAAALEEYWDEIATVKRFRQKPWLAGLLVLKPRMDLEMETLASLRRRNHCPKLFRNRCSITPRSLTVPRLKSICFPSLYWRVVMSVWCSLSADEDT